MIQHDYEAFQRTTRLMRFLVWFEEGWWQQISKFCVVHLLCLVHVDAPKEQHHGHEDVDGEGELLREHEAADDGREHVGRGPAVLLHYVV